MFGSCGGGIGGSVKMVELLGVPCMYGVVVMAGTPRSLTCKQGILVGIGVFVLRLSYTCCIIGDVVRS